MKSIRTKAANIMNFGMRHNLMGGKHTIFLLRLELAVIVINQYHSS